MSTPQRCLAQAQEAERLAALVSYERDRVRLSLQAAEWRARAAELEDAPASAEPVEPVAPSALRRVVATLLAPTRRRGL